MGALYATRAGGGVAGAEGGGLGAVAAELHAAPATAVAARARQEQGAAPGELAARQAVALGGEALDGVEGQAAEGHGDAGRRVGDPPRRAVVGELGRAA